MNLQLTNKVIVVTGGASGIGKAVVHALAAEGAIPVIVDRHTSAVQTLTNELLLQGHTTLQVIAELTENGSAEKIIQTVINHTGRIDGLVNNAGINDGVGLESGDLSRFRNSLEQNLVHYYSMAHFALPWLKKSAQSAIVNVVSKTAETGQGNTSAYAASNGGRAALTREWAVELLPAGIRVNGVVVAECATPAYQTWLETLPNPAEKLKEIQRHIPLGNRMTTPEEIAAAIIFLLSPVSSHTTGQLLHIDGGYVHLDRALAGKLQN
ncbi:MAG: SDR family oxidoreductase [Chitinophagaceae bacterium]|nr:SDR family oxidoreductase [Chitinophagaceae bacterium]MCA6477591.1 SDR family oxidoreductase [Chitinophagaceae bacterium]MCA6479365.1 SDR family oxidoreductase [Chitinophagaceae bacterium]MCA6484971.1 SDR family oxidoreductase [Chitinophagaceae bacterium]